MAKKKRETVEGTELIRQERMRQVAVEGWTPEHDDSHDLGELAEAAACYAATGEVFTMSRPSGRGSITIYSIWPWDDADDKRQRNCKDEIIRADELLPSVRIRQLAKAGALIAAEIDRLQRLENK